MDWVSDVLDWIKELIKAIFDAFWDLLSDIGLILLSAILDIFLLIISFLTLPSFFAGGLSEFLGGIDPAVMYFLSKSGLGAGLELIGAGVMFRLTRKLLTLGQW
ncbi:hypothetical protein [Vreelandella utahensis]|uniref:hypothetical protein n=2 Tax=Vreelandella halophila TaxID=86177 RepID=UPI0009873661|nr:hypothetical protein [Halomonas utahensis]